MKHALILSSLLGLGLIVSPALANPLAGARKQAEKIANKVEEKNEEIDLDHAGHDHKEGEACTTCTDHGHDHKDVAKDEAKACCGTCGGEAGKCTATADKACCGNCGGETKMTAFGEPMKLKPEQTIPATDVLANPEAFKGKLVRMEGVVSDVCQTKGCWIKMDAEGSAMPIMVIFTCPVEGRLIPVEAKGRKAVVEGEITIVEVSVEELKHLAEESGNPEAAAKITGPGKQIRIKGPSAEVAM